MTIAYTLTIPAVDTGYTLWELLIAAGIPASALPITRRVASLKLQIDTAETDNVYLVPRNGPVVTTVGNVPDQYGYILSLTGSLYSSFYEDSRQNINGISLEEVCLATDAANSIVHLWAYTI